MNQKELEDRLTTAETREEIDRLFIKVSLIQAFRFILHYGSHSRLLKLAKETAYEILSEKVSQS